MTWSLTCYIFSIKSVRFIWYLHRRLIYMRIFGLNMSVKMHVVWCLLFNPASTLSESYKILLWQYLKLKCRRWRYRFGNFFKCPRIYIAHLLKIKLLFPVCFCFLLHYIIIFSTFHYVTNVFYLFESILSLKLKKKSGAE